MVSIEHIDFCIIMIIASPMLADHGCSTISHVSTINGAFVYIWYQLLAIRRSVYFLIMENDQLPCTMVYISYYNIQLCPELFFWASAISSWSPTVGKQMVKDTTHMSFNGNGSLWHCLCMNLRNKLYIFSFNHVAMCLLLMICLGWCAPQTTFFKRSWDSFRFWSKDSKSRYMWIHLNECILGHINMIAVNGDCYHTSICNVYRWWLYIIDSCKLHRNLYIVAL